jgi:hypothetical protein
MAEKREKVIDMEQISCRKVSADGRFSFRNQLFDSPAERKSHPTVRKMKRPGV